MGAAVLGDCGSDNDSGIGNLGDVRSTSDSDDLGDGLGTGGNDRVLGDVASADTLEEGDSLGDDVVALTVGVNAVEDVLDEVLVWAEARGILVVRALGLEVHEGVETSGNNRRARRSLSRLRRLAGDWVGLLTGRLLRSGLLLDGSLRLGRQNDSRRDSLGLGTGLRNWADSGAHRDSNSNNVRSSLARALGDFRSTACDGLGGGRVDGRGGVVGSDKRSGRSGGGGSGRLAGCGLLSRSGLLGGSSLLAGSSLLGGSSLLAGSRLLGGSRLLAWGCLVSGRSLLAGGGLFSRSGLLSRCGLLARCGLLDGGSLLAGSSLLGRSGFLSRSGLLSRRSSLLARSGLLFGSSLLRRSGISLQSGDRSSLDHLGRGARECENRSAGLGSGLAAVPLDLVARNLALLAEGDSLVDDLLGVDDPNLLSTAALVVDNSRSTSLAIRGLLAHTSVRHIVVEFETGVELGRHVEAVNGEGINTSIGTNTNGETSLISLIAGTRDDLSETESAALDITALSKVALARPAATEVEASVGVEGASRNVTPVPTILLLRSTLVDNVARARESLCTRPIQTKVERNATTAQEAKGSGSLLHAGSGNNNRKSRLHLALLLNDYQV